MAWYAWTKRHGGWCFRGIDMIHEYKMELHQQWFDNLSEEDKQRVIEYRKQQEAKSDKELRDACARLLFLSTAVAGIYGSRR